MITYLIIIAAGVFATFLLIYCLKYLGALIGCAGLCGWLLIGALGLFLKIDIIVKNAFISWASASVLFLLLLHFIPAARSFLEFLGNSKKTTHGTAEFAGKKTLEKFTTEKGMPLGTRKSGKKVRVRTHILSCAPTRSGKDVGGIIPFLLEHKGSVIVNDIKGEDYAVTYRQRETLGSRVYLIDPFGITGGRKNAFNWLDTIDVANPDCVGQALMIADMLIANDTKNSGDPHFDDSARNLLQGLILLAAADPNRDVRNIVSVRQMLTLPESKFMALMEGAIGHPAAFDIISRCASKISGTPERERGSIISTAQRHTAFLDDPRIAETLRGSDFDINKIKQESMSIYLVLPADRLKTNRSFIRVFFGLALSAVTATQGKAKEDIVFLFNEFGQLGYMAEVEEKISLVGGFGAWFWIFVQDLSQLKGIYQKWQTFIANSTRQFFGCNDLDTAKYISESLGQYTETVSKYDTGAKNDSFIARNLLNPDEVMRLPKETIVAFVQGEAPIVLNRITYYSDKDYQGKFDQNPYV